MKLKHLLKQWEDGYAKAECGKMVDEKDATLIVEKVTCKACKRAKGYQKLMRLRPGGGKGE
jgi:hypothetical protein